MDEILLINLISDHERNDRVSGQRNVRRDYPETFPQS
jgi:hypothetical protein